MPVCVCYHTSVHIQTKCAQKGRQIKNTLETDEVYMLCSENELQTFISPQLHRTLQILVALVCFLVCKFIALVHSQCSHSVVFGCNRQTKAQKHHCKQHSTFNRSIAICTGTQQQRYFLCRSLRVSFVKEKGQRKRQLKREDKGKKNTHYIQKYTSIKIHFQKKPHTI